MQTIKDQANGVGNYVPRRAGRWRSHTIWGPTR